MSDFLENSVTNVTLTIKSYDGWVGVMFPETTVI